MLDFVVRVFCFLALSYGLTKLDVMVFYHSCNMHNTFNFSISHFNISLINSHVIYFSFTMNELFKIFGVRYVIFVLVMHFLINFLYIMTYYPTILPFLWARQARCGVILAFMQHAWWNCVLYLGNVWSGHFIFLLVLYVLHNVLRLCGCWLFLVWQLIVLWIIISKNALQLLLFSVCKFNIYVGYLNDYVFNTQSIFFFLCISFSLWIIELYVSQIFFIQYVYMLFKYISIIPTILIWLIKM